MVTRDTKLKMIFNKMLVEKKVCYLCKQTKALEK